MTGDPLGGYRAPSRLVLGKEVDHVDEHCQRFIELSPFATLATLATADALDLAEFGWAPRSVLVLTVRRVCFQCAKAVMRSGLWDPTVQVPRSAWAPFSAALEDHCRPATEL